MDFKTEWGKTDMPEQKETEYKPFVEGKYTAELEEVKLDKTAAPAKLTFTFKILEGEYKNRKLWKNITLNEKSFPWLKQDLHRLKIDATPESEEDICIILNEKGVGATVSIFVKPRMFEGKQYENVYINGLKNYADVVEGAGTRDEPRFDSEEEIPF